MLKEWIVTLYKHEDLDGFYEDMETPGGNLYIPDRAVDVTKQRPISRNTNYMLTYEEAMLIKDDERVWDVDLLEKLEESIKAINRNANAKILFFELSLQMVKFLRLKRKFAIK